jgi:integrase
MLFNKAMEWEHFKGSNPTQYVKKFKEISRDRFLQANELPLFLKAVDEEEPLFRDFFYILLLTGQRKTNVLEMQWKDISFEYKYWKIPETKNGEPLVVPLVEGAIDILKERKIKSKNLVWVFESETSASGRLVDPKKAWYRILKRSGIEDLRMHDLRRTMGSYQTILGSSSFIVAKSLGHKSIKSTEIYARLNIDPVRQSMENATNFMLNKENNDDE